ncbi:MAG: helix-turn-helix domain-containing protein [Deltaproteobacteria bacterium]|nr:helix-turn-helix domain-containing protein [Deltaproteobacteria bacterium]
MERFENLNFYELLEIPVSASPFEIRQGYRNALSIYEEDSMISDSFFSDEERNAILRRIEEAFSTLIDKGERTAYNKKLAGSGVIDAALLDKNGPNSKGPIPLFSLKKTGGRESLSARVKKRIEKKDYDEVSREILSKSLISGRDLEKLRKYVGVAVEEIFEVTRISLKVLTAIESDDVASLPPIFYLKNFLKAYAELFKLDSQKVIDGYLENIASLKDKR